LLPVGKKFRLISNVHTFDLPNPTSTFLSIFVTPEARLVT